MRASEKTINAVMKRVWTPKVVERHLGRSGRVWFEDGTICLAAGDDVVRQRVVSTVSDEIGPAEFVAILDQHISQLLEENRSQPTKQEAEAALALAAHRWAGGQGSLEEFRDALGVYREALPH